MLHTESVSPSSAWEDSFKQSEIRGRTEVSPASYHKGMDENKAIHRDSVAPESLLSPGHLLLLRRISKKTAK